MEKSEVNDSTEEVIEGQGFEETTEQEPIIEEQQLDAIRQLIEQAQTFDEAVSAQAKAIEALEAYTCLEDEPVIDEFSKVVDEADKKVRSIVQDGKEEFVDSFEGEVVEKSFNDDGTITFKAIVAQVDTANLNHRIYPKSTFMANFPRVKREMKVNKFLGLVDHPSLFEGPSISRIAFVFTDVKIEDKNVIVHGRLTTATEAGKEVKALWEDDINLEWSLRGWGKAVPEDMKKYDKDPYGYNGNFVLKEYFWDSVDAVVRGAAKTKTLEINLDSVEPDQASIIAQEEEIAPVMESVTTMSEEVTRTEEITDAPEVKPEVKIDEEAITKKANELVAQAMDAYKLNAYKEQKIAELSASDENFHELVALHIESAKSIEEVNKVVETLAPKVEALRKPSPYKGVGVINREKTYKEHWAVGNEVRERPENREELKAQLRDGIEDKGTSSWDNPMFIFDTLLKNYELSHPDYFDACLKNSPYLDAASTTSVMTVTGANVPQVLPLMRKVFPKLIPYEIASVQPLSAPDGRIYTIDYKRVNNDSSFADSASFDSTWADHTEGESKSQVKPELTYTTITAKPKAIFYDVTSYLVQDMKALHNIDAEAELLVAAAGEIAREINYSFLEMMRTGATATTLTYGTQKPSGYTSDLDWYEQLGAYIAKAGASISEKTYIPTRYLICDARSAALLSTTKGYQQFPVPQEFGAGLTGTGTWGTTIKIFVAEWFRANTMMLVAKGDSWSYTGSVYAPYIPLYISPSDYVPEKNTMSRSVSTRYAKAVLNGNTIGLINIASETGVAPFHTL